MPRRRQRFAQLERELKASGYAPDPNSRAGQYLNFKKGINRINVANPPNAAERLRKGVAILPFNLPLELPVTNDDRFLVPITALSNTGRLSLGLSNNELGYEALSPLTKNPGNFYPALLRVFVKTSSTPMPTSPTSGILRRPYKRYAGRSYSIPFGRSEALVATFTAATVTEENSKQALILQIKATNPLTSVSYDPEVFTSQAPDLTSLI